MAREFRADIEGLRALAVLPVLLFHLDPAWCPGGFAGVDIFFVISGYLITRMILGAGAAFDLRAFYVRRFFRLFPALQAVLIGTLIAGWFILGPVDYGRTARSALAAAFAVSNVYFWGAIDYFDAATHAYPLLHTWSLGVEEQFYLLWPALLVLAQARRWPLIPVIAAAGGLSFTAILLLQPHAPEAVFYLMPFRVFELAVGASLVRLETRWADVVTRHGAWIGAAGIAVLAFTFLALNHRTPWPGVWALAPVLGAALLILAGRTPVWTRALGYAALRFVGRISYSVYLVHWPLVTLYRTYTITEPTRLELVALGIGSLMLGWLLYALVEVPFRITEPKATPIPSPAPQGGWGNLLARLRSPRVRAGAVGLTCVALLTGATAIVIKSGFPSRLDRTRVQLTDQGLTFAGDLCSFKRNRCVFGDPEATSVVYVIGDSHALNLIYGLDGLFRETRIKGIALYDHGCLYAFGSKRFKGGVADEPCRRNVAEAYEFLAGNRNPVILAGNFNGYIGEIGPAAASTALGGGPAEYYAFVEQRLAEGLEKIGAGRRNIVIVKQTYQTGVDLPRCLSQPGGDETSRAARCAPQSRSRALEGAAEADRMIAALAAKFANVATIDPKRVFCAGETCTVVDDKQGLYFRDIDHLTNAGSAFLIGQVREVLLKGLRSGGS